MNMGITPEELGHKLQRMKEEEKRREKKDHVKKLVKRNLLDGLQLNVDKHLRDLHSDNA